MLQTERATSSNHTRGRSVGNTRSGYWVRLGKEVRNGTKLDILEFLLDTPLPDEFDWKADIKYLYYKDGKILGMMIYKIVPMVGKPTPLIVHIVGTEGFKKTRAGYQFMMDTFKDLKKDYNIICAHIPNERAYIINPMLKFGFSSYSEDSYGKFYYLYLDKIRS